MIKKQYGGVTLALFFLVAQGASSTNQAPLVTNSPVTISPTNNNSNHIYIGITQENINSARAYISDIVTNINQKVTTTTSYTVERSKELCSSFAEYMYHNKLKLSIYAMIGSYAFVQYKLVSLRYALNKDTNWSLWNRTVSFDELLTLPQRQLAESIIKEVQRRHINLENPEDFFMPIVTFLKEVEREQELLQTYLTITTWLRRLYLAKISFINQELDIHYKERLQRLAYIKNVLLTCIAEHKYAHYAAAGV